MQTPKQCRYLNLQDTVSGHGEVYLTLLAVLMLKVQCNSSKCLRTFYIVSADVAGTGNSNSAHPLEPCRHLPITQDIASAQIILDNVILHPSPDLIPLRQSSPLPDQSQQSAAYSKSGSREMDSEQKCVEISDL